MWLTMKLKTVLLGLALSVSMAPAAWANSLTFQNVTFNMTLNGGNLNLNVVNALNANGDWAGIDHLKAFAINNFGNASGLTATSAGATWTTVPGGLSASGGGGCNGSGGHTCFSATSPFLALSNNFTITIAKASGAFDLGLSDGKGLFGPHLKVYFTGADQGGGHGNLLSKTVPGSVPVPSTLPLLGAGLVGLAVWRRKATAA
jgi:hypothetical protein